MEEELRVIPAEPGQFGSAQAQSREESRARDSEFLTRNSWRRGWALAAVAVLILVVVAYFVYARRAKRKFRRVFGASPEERGEAPPPGGAASAENAGRHPEEAPGPSISSTESAKLTRSFGAPSSRVNWARFGGDLSDGPGSRGSLESPGGVARGGKSGTAGSVVEGLRGDFEGMDTLRAGSYGPGPGASSSGPVELGR